MSVITYNQAEFEAGRITPEHLDLLLASVYPGAFASFASLVQAFQAAAGLKVDGMLGPKTRAVLERRAPPPRDLDEAAAALRAEVRSDPIQIDAGGWMLGRRVRKIPIHPDWFGGVMTPDHAIHHLTDTDSGAEGMARRRTIPYDKKRHGRGKSSWHATALRDGWIIQMVPFSRQAYHAGGAGNIGLPNGAGHPNRRSVGIEIVGKEPDSHPPEQVLAVARIFDALNRWPGAPIPRANHLGHRDVNSIKNCPGDAWYELKMPLVLEAVYG